MQSLKDAAILLAILLLLATVRVSPARRAEPAPPGKVLHIERVDTRAVPVPAVTPEMRAPEQSRG